MKGEKRGKKLNTFTISLPLHLQRVIFDIAIALITWLTLTIFEAVKSICCRKHHRQSQLADVKDDSFKIPEPPSLENWSPDGGVLSTQGKIERQTNGESNFDQMSTVKIWNIRFPKG